MWQLQHRSARNMWFLSLSLLMVAPDEDDEDDADADVDADDETAPEKVYSRAAANDTAEEEETVRLWRRTDQFRPEIYLLAPSERCVGVGGGPTCQLAGGN